MYPITGNDNSHCVIFTINPDANRAIYKNLVTKWLLSHGILEPIKPTDILNVTY